MKKITTCVLSRRLSFARKSGRRSSKQHRGAGRADEAREATADREDPGVDQRRARQRAAHVDAAGDHEQAAEQHDERAVLVQLLQQHVPALRAFRDQEVGGDRHREQRGHDRAVLVVLPPVVGD
jgi:hypothetical protein